MDRLVEGIGHSVDNGAVLLGLSAWHLYPDMVVVGGLAVAPRQADHLIAPGGDITVGLQGIDQDDSSGVHWSLSLTHVRYYGDPVKSRGSTNSGLSRILIDDIWQVALGSLFALWGTQGFILAESAEFVRLLWQRCYEGLLTYESDTLTKAVPDTYWLSHLAHASTRYLESSGHESDNCKQLLGLGRRRSKMLGQFESSIPIFGITDAVFVGILRPEMRVPYLRDIATKISSENDILVVMIRHQPSTRPSDQSRISIGSRNGETHLQSPQDYYSMIEIATTPTRHLSIDRPTSSNKDAHHAKRWIYSIKLDKDGRKKVIKRGVKLNEIRDCEEIYSLGDAFGEEPIVFHNENLRFSWVNPPMPFSGGSFAAETLEVDRKRSRRWFFWESD